MSEHLSPETLSKWMAGDSSPSDERHLRDCPQCTAELNALQETLGQFRAAVVHWADRECSRRVPDSAGLARISRGVFIRRLRWLTAAAAIALVALIPVYKNSIEHRRQVEISQESVDAELLERINAHLSQTAPMSLQPLTTLVSAPNNIKGEGKR
jgi:anti-sigma factor RsiW